jgi:hypothetical protein
MMKLPSFLIIVSAVIAVFALHGTAQTASDRESDAVKRDLSELYGAPSRKIAVHLKNGVKVMGYINAMDVDTFTLVDAKRGNKMEIRYADVSRVNKTGISKTQKTLLVAAGIGALIAVGIVLRPKPKGGLRCLLCN